MAVPEWLRSHQISHPKQLKFLMAFTAKGMIGKAAEIAEVDRHTHWDWLKNDPQYKAAFEEAKTHLCELIEDAAFERALHGVSKPVFHQGQECGAVQEYSDGVLLRLMSGNMPTKYREKVSTELTGQNGEPIKIIVETGIPDPKPKPANGAAS